MLIMGEKDYVLKFPGMEEYIRSEKVKEFMPNLEIIFHEEGNHFVQEQFPEEVNQLLITFLNKHSTWWRWCVSSWVQSPEAEQKDPE